MPHLLLQTIKRYPRQLYSRSVLILATLTALGIFGLIYSVVAGPDVIFEAESGTLVGPTVANDSNASEGQYIQFHSPSHVACTPGTLSAHGPCIDEAFITPPQTGASNVRMGDCLPVPNPSTYCSNGLGEQSAFRTQCMFSHMNNDDAVLFLNRPGEAHLHTYYGNTGTNAHSTSASLRNSGNSTCRGGIFNRSAYWVPTMLDGTNGRPLSMIGRNTVYPDLEAYYKLGYQGISHLAVQPFPDGLQMIAGNASSATTPNTAVNPPVTYYCDGQSGGNRVIGPHMPNVPSCPVGHAVTMHINFPQCWDGVNVTAPGGRSHLTYGVWQVGCPQSHPVGLPFVEMLVRYQVRPGEDSSRWRLSCDNYALSTPGGYCGHADYIFAWDPTAFPTIIERCHRAQQDCKYQLGNGDEPIF